jgi:patatin-like phospholipase/acyl hydrolase
MHSSVTTVKKRPLRILTFDGGGFRGIASLVILKALLSRVDPKIKAGEHQPGNYFDLIGGTSTGGLLALMFGRLGMTVKAAIDQYHALAPQIFGKDGGLQDFLRKGARFDSAPFENALAEWLLDQPLIDPEPGTPGHTYVPLELSVLFLAR